jgi:hypothetical protein
LLLEAGNKRYKQSSPSVAILVASKLTRILMMDA